MTKRFLPFALMLLAAGACQQEETATPTADTLTLEERYLLSIEDAMVAEPDEVTDQLVALTPDNPNLSFSEAPDGADRVLVLTWTRFPDSFSAGDTTRNSWGEMWVTTVPEVKDWFAGQTSVSDPAMRAKQLLGLPPQNEYSHFVEMWVRVDDLFRPSADPETNDAAAVAELAEDAPAEHAAWFQDNILYSYFPPRFPWTRLGYTYDWGSTETEVGVSEFVLRKGSLIEVVALHPTDDYLTP